MFGEPQANQRGSIQSAQRALLVFATYYRPETSVPNPSLPIQTRVISIEAYWPEVAK